MTKMVYWNCQITAHRLYLIYNNSEHFCRLCRSNKAESLQVKAAAINAAVSVLKLLAGVNLIPDFCLGYFTPDIISGEYAKLDEVQFE